MGRIAGVGAAIGFGLVAGLLWIAWKDWDWGHSLLAPMCHQKAERCLAIGGTGMAVCARCLGIYLGLSLGCAAYWRRRFRVARVWWILGVAVGLNLGDFLLEWAGVYGNALWLRLVLGAILGVAIPVFVFSRLDDGES